jgi:(p)ppGpp synthase/HD superfamily hydrolase
MQVSTAVSGTAGFTEAYAFLCDAYEERLRREDRSPAHPLAVAELLAADGQPSLVVVAGLLHDVLEDTDVNARELEDRFGRDAARIVAALTEDRSRPRYRDRKAALRRRTLEAGPLAGTIALADKLAKLQAATKSPRRRKLEHYRATLDGVEARYGTSRLADLLRAELERLATR